jgi:prepilin peptidase CpaA
MVPLSLVFVAAVAAFTTAAAISDWRTRRLPNRLTVPAFAAAVLMHTAVNGLAGLGFSLAGSVTGFGILLVLWLIGGGGGGDVKLMGALGAWLGATFILHVFVLSAVVAAIATAAVLSADVLNRGFGFVRRRYLTAGSAGRLGSANAPDSEGGPSRRADCRILPYAVPVAAATWMTLAYAWFSCRLPW